MTTWRCHPRWQSSRGWRTGWPRPPPTGAAALLTCWVRTPVKLVSNPVLNSLCLHTQGSTESGKLVTLPPPTPHGQGYRELFI